MKATKQQPLKPIKLWAIVDTTFKENPRFCYADEKKTKGQMAVYDKKPVIPKQWKFYKKVIRVIMKSLKILRQEELPAALPVQQEAVALDEMAEDFARKIQTKPGTASRLNAIEWFKAGYNANSHHSNVQNKDINELKEQARLYAENCMYSKSWDRKDSEMVGVFYKFFIDKLLEPLSTQSAKDSIIKQ